MAEKQTQAVTGAFGYSGKYIAGRLLSKGHEVLTLTNSIHRQNPFGEKIRAYPFNFEKPERLTQSLRGVSVLYNTYWVRFNYKNFSYADAVRNTLTLFKAAREAEVARIVHISITNSSLESELEYFNGKARLEKALIESGVSYSILRPAVLFGKEDILINNIAWILRKFPFFCIFGDGTYRVQPIYVDDLAELAVAQGEDSGNRIINAIGPETYSYRELVETIGEIIGKKKRILSVSPHIGYFIASLIGKFMGDVFVTRDEITGLMSGLLAVDAPPVGHTKLSDWAREHAATLGKHYTSELARRTDRVSGYQSN